MPWTCTTCPKARTRLATRPGSLVRWTFQIGPRGRTCTCNFSGFERESPLLFWLTTRGLVPRRICTELCAF